MEPFGQPTPARVTPAGSEKCSCCAFHPNPLWVHVIVMLKFELRVLCFLVPPPLPTPLLFRRLVVAMTDALLGVVHIDFLLH
jgi:hypothetical protein